MASEGYHEPVTELSEEVRNVSRALKSVQEELAAIDWYHQRVAASHDESLKRVLAHNRDEEVEHATMALEWLRRMMPKFDEAMRRFLFAEADITAIEEIDKRTPEGGGSVGTSGKGLGIRGLR